MLDTFFLWFKEKKIFFYVLSFSFIRKFVYLLKYGTIFARVVIVLLMLW